MCLKYVLVFLASPGGWLREGSASFSFIRSFAPVTSAARNNVIHLRRVKGHCGIIGNEQADVLAKEGALDPLREVAQIPKLPPSVIKSLHREGLERRWNEYWQSRTDCR